MRTPSTAGLAVVVAVGLGLVSGCGGDSKPGYCADREDLTQSVKDLGDVQLAQPDGITRLKAQLQTVKADAGQLADSAKSDFPDESNAVTGSVTNLEQSVQGVAASAEPQQVVQVGADVKAVVVAANGFNDATDSKCS
jgi:hypothetical protein